MSLLGKKDLILVLGSRFELGVADPVVFFSWFLVDVNPGASARGQPGPQVHQLRRGGWFALLLLLSENINVVSLI